MKKADYYLFVLLVLIATAGIWIQGFKGGLIAGSSLTFLVAATIGKYLANKTIKKIDKNVHDIILNRKKD